MNQPRVLLVNDDPVLLESCRALLDKAHFIVTTAASGPEALALLAANPRRWDLLLLALNMPGMDNLAVMHQLESHGIDISVLALSGESAFHWDSKAFPGGSFDHVRKPFDYDELVNSIHNALHKHALERSFDALRKQLERSERLHRFMIESSPDIILIVDRESRFRFINERAEELLGYRKDELLGQHYSLIVDPQSLARAAHCFNERRTEQRASREDEIWLLCKPGPVAGSERRRLAIEMNAMGVYENESTNQRGEKQLKDFSGTYVVARDITERLASQKMIHYQAYHDLLTGLPNRALFLDRLTNAISQARRQQSRLGVMFLDLDRFKTVNDSLGHDAGDVLLKSVAERLKACLRESDTLARIGGDEFMVLLPLAGSIATAKTVAEKIVRTIKQPLRLGNHEVCTTASVGIAMYPEDGETADALIKNADIAMYHTKDLGKDGFNIYTQELSTLQQSRLSLESEIRRGIREGQFAVYYQPQVNAVDSMISGMEALLRWNHPERGLLTPGYFLPIAEESTLIIELGDWAMRTALQQVQQWRAENLKVGKLAVNFSMRQIDQPDFVDKIIQSLKHNAFPAANFEIEITESSLVSDAEKTIGKLRQLHNYGVHIAIDDFGTGYSSLSMLQKLPISRLKIDRSFIQDLKTDADRSIIEAIAHMAKGLKLEMVAEGVEEDYQLRYLRKLQCPVVQGHIYSRCISSSEMRQLLEKREGFAGKPGARQTV